MNLLTSALLGLVFLTLGGAATFLMYHLWGFPFDKATRTSAAPQSLMRLHRLLGYAYVTLYLFMMAHMVPRLWQYGGELPPRTVAHLLLGYLIGVILLLKIAILRFFRHFEEWMPALGTLLFVCTVLLLALSLPTALREVTLASGAGASSRASGATTSGTPAQATFQRLCSQCHAASKVDTAPPRTEAEVVSLLQRMQGRGLKVTDAEVQTLREFLMQKYVKPR